MDNPSQRDTDGDGLGDDCDDDADNDGNDTNTGLLLSIKTSAISMFTSDTMQTF